MSTYRKKPVIVEAHQWWRNGDHPEDYPERNRPAVDWSEGLVVRYFRDPTVSGTLFCEECHYDFHCHGWIDTREGGHRVCPGDWIITGVENERYPCKPSIFEATYELAVDGA